MTGRHTRILIRVLIGIALCSALGACAAVPVPEDLPAVSLQQAGLYRLEIALFVFYSALLLITPAFAGLIRGHLPIEVSARGAKFAEEADQSAELTRATIEELEVIIASLADGLGNANLEIKQLRKAARDNKQPPVNSI